jgi:anti-sigma B factor antagonist
MAFAAFPRFGRGLNPRCAGRIQSVSVPISNSATLEEPLVSEGTSQPFTVQQAGDVTIVRFAGPKLGLGAKEALYDLVETQGHRQLVLNFASVQYLSSAPIGMLVSLKNRADAAGGSVRLCQLDPDVKEILSLTAVLKLFSLYETEQAAIDSYRGP